MNLDKQATYPSDPVLANQMTYPGVAIFTLLKDLQQAELGFENSILIVNTHLVFNTLRGDIKFSMLIFIMKTILKINQAYNVSDIFFGGDFNLVPNSMLYKWISTSEADLDADLREYSNQKMLSSLKDDMDIEELVKLGDRKFSSSSEGFNRKRKIDSQYLRSLVKSEILLPEKDSLSETIFVINSFTGIFADDNHLQFVENISKLLCFKSSYAELNRKFNKRYRKGPNINLLNFFFDEKYNNNDCFISQYTHNFKNAVDYIWFAANNKYRIARILQMPDSRVLSKNNLSCPIENFGSDHFCLVADFYFRP